VFLVYDGKLIGTISVSDTIRKEAKSVVENLKKSGIKKTYMLTGDINSTAESIKNELSIDCFTAELLPDEKLKAIEDIKQTYNTVCFVGDGINDAPVLSASDCGIAMGLGSEIAIEASDVVLASGSLDALPKAVKLAKKVVNTVKSNIVFALAVKVAVITLATLGFAPMWLAVVADTGISVICVLHSSGKHL
jgi:Cd2+/Zn2+-exporting ATPase